MENRVTKLSQEFSRTESRILGALSRFDDFLLNPLIQGHSGTAPETTWNTLRKNQGTNEDDSQSDLHPEARVSQSQTTRNFGPDDSYDSNGSWQFPGERDRNVFGSTNHPWRDVQYLLR